MFDDSLHSDGAFGGGVGGDSAHGSNSTAQTEGAGRARGSQRDRLQSTASNVSVPSQHIKDFLKRTESMMNMTSELSRSQRKRSGIRYFILCMVRHKAFAMFIYTSITYNTVTIAMNDFWADRENGSVLKLILDTSDWVVLVIFTVEMFLKMFSMGIGFRSPRDYSDPNNTEDESMPVITDEDHEDDGYFVSNWNRMDCCIVILSWILIAIRECACIMYVCVFVCIL